MGELADVEEQLGYRALRDIYAERTNGIVFWIGAGLSAPAGIPLWRALRERLESELDTRARNIEPAAQKKLVDASVAIKTIKDPWRAFDKLSSALGPVSYDQVIRECLSARDGLSPPVGYEKIWQLRPAGVITTNLDRLATRQYNRSLSTGDLLEVAGTRLNETAYLLKSGRPFAVNIHGVADERGTWVLTRSEVDRLQAMKAYQAFVHALFLSKTVVFVGLSLEDRAAGGLLSQLRKDNIDAGSHFWITNRRDLDGEDWASSRGIHVIHYDADRSEKEHKKLLEIFDSLRRFVPREPDALPIVAGQRGAITTLPEPDELEARDSESIRNVLNAYAQNLLSNGDSEGSKRYREFCDRYDIAIQRSYNVSEKPPKNVFFGYQVVRRIGRGLFGDVYEAIASNGGDKVAIKVLHEFQRQQDEMLSAFRRGVRALQIVAAKDVRGMVRIREAFELPSSIVMEFVEGPTLWDAVTSRTIQSWTERLEVARQIATIVRSGHALPERVLHRDIRPHNIILRDYYEKGQIDVCVLDFDLSWHKDAAERSIDAKALTQLAYAAPEQIERIPGVSARSALVDSFGLAMTIYFAITGEHPSVGAYKIARWQRDVIERFVAAAPSTLKWQSSPVRLARLVTRATSEKQSERLDFSQIVAALELMIAADRAPSDVDDPELWVDEIATRAFGALEYDWDIDHRRASRRYTSGLSINVEPGDLPPHIAITVSWSSAGEEERKNIGKYLPKHADQIGRVLRGSGWQRVQNSRTAMSLAVSAQVPIETAQTTVSDLSKGVAEISDLVRFE